MSTLREKLGGEEGVLIALALVVGAGAGVGAIGFRYLIEGFTWLFTGLAESIANVATENRASLVIVGRPSTPGPSAFGSTGEVIAAALAAPVAILVGDAERIREVEVVREPEHVAGSFDADGIAVELARRIGGGSVEVSDLDPEALEDLRPGRLRVLPATSWQLLAGTENPPVGSAVLILPDN